MNNIRLMNEQDLPLVSSIEKECFIAPWKDSDLEYELFNNPINEMYVIEVDNKVVGFIDYMVTFNSSTISQIAISSSNRRQGLSGQLLDKMFEELRKKDDKVEFVTLEVRMSNLAAQKLYLKHGFEIITTKKGYYSNGEDALYMVKRMD